VAGNISLSLDGRVTGPGGEYDMSWVAPHAVTGRALDHLVKVTSSATTALLGRKTYQGFSSFWPAVAGDEQADPRDQPSPGGWTELRRSSFPAPCGEPTGTTRASPPAGA
jgi:dihydrofolate reductase